MYNQLEKYISGLTEEFGSIPDERKITLKEIADFITAELKENGTVRLNFICTHNSRRSHLAQIWTQTAAVYYDIGGIETYSGGTEATAFNPRAVEAVARAGFQVNNPGGENPKYEVRFSKGANPIICFSKKFDDSLNPEKNFAAIMTCSDADKNCPIVPGTSYRKAVTYRDPKESDGTAHEKETYDERCRQIATEMFYMMSRI